MERLLISLFLILITASTLYASQSTIVEAEGFSCMGYDKSRKLTEEEALVTAKKKAVEHAATYIKSESRLKDFELEKDLMEAYSNATVKVVQELSRAWYRDAALGDCCRVRIKAEVIPDNEATERISKGKDQTEDPSAPLNVRLWTNKREYKEGDRIKIYIRGNKPFYARILYQGVSSGLLQLLPNPYRLDSYFNGGVIYEIPSGADQFDMEVTPPFGRESIIVYASTAPLGEINLVPAGGVYKITTGAEKVGERSRAVFLKEKNPEQQAKTVGERSRGVSLKEKDSEQQAKTAEFSERRISFDTSR